MDIIKIPDHDHARILRIAAHEAAVGIEALVERVFEDLPPDADYLPIIGGWPFLDCKRSEQKQLAIAALLAVKWAENELPKWARPLLLTAEECIELQQGCSWRENHRSLLRANYSMHARSVSWDIARMRPFERFCADQLAPSRSLV